MGAKYQIRDKKDGRRKEPFVMVPFRWMDLPAWKALSGNAVSLLLHLIRLSGGDNGHGNERGELFLSERGAAAALGIARNTASAAFDLLTKTGWIRPVRVGHFAVKAGEKELRATVWRLTFQPYPRGRQGPSGEYLRWLPGEDLPICPEAVTDPLRENSRAQNLNGSGSKIEHGTSSDVETGAKIDPVRSEAPSDATCATRSEIEPHLDIAIGKRSGGREQNSERPDQIASDPFADPVRRKVAQHCQTLGKAGRRGLAERCGITLNELDAFTTGGGDLAVGKRVVLRALVRACAG